MVKTLQILLVLFMGMAFGARMKESYRIVGGENADRDEYPWLVKLLYNEEFACGASIIDENTILTAAHCVDFDPDQRNAGFSIKAGDYKRFKTEASEQLRIVKKVIMHEMYNKEAYLDKDVAVLRLTLPLKLNKYVQTIRLATRETYYPAKTQEARLQMLSREACEQKSQFYRTEFTTNMLCSVTFLKGLCGGDSGGPLMCYDEVNKPVQVGIASSADFDCWTGYNVFARVSFLRAWIKKNSQ